MRMLLLSHPLVDQLLLVLVEAPMEASQGQLKLLLLEITQPPFTHAQFALIRQQMVTWRQFARDTSLTQ
jgi:hypothetical protein